jgi:tetratricopeptide (TPR) repeat protein
MMLGGIHYERQDYQRAAKTYKTLLDAYPEDPAALSGTAWSLLKLNMKQDAVTDFQRLLSIAPSYPFAQQGLNMATGSSNSTAPTPAPTQPQ